MSIEKVYFSILDGVILNDVSIVSTDESDYLDSLKRNFGYTDTLISCKSVALFFDPIELLKFNFKIRSIALSDGAFNLQQEDDKNSNITRIFSSEPKDSADTTSSNPLNFLVNNVRVREFRFTLKNHNSYTEKEDDIVNFSDLDIYNIDIDLRDINLKNDTLFADINNISGTDSSSFNVKSLVGQARISANEVYVEDLRLNDGFSSVNANYFSMKYQSARDFADFVDRVTLEADFNETYVDFKTIGKIAPSLTNSSLAFYINGKFRGPVSSISTSDLKVFSKSRLSYVELEAQVSGLPNVDETIVFANIDHCYTTSMDVANIIASINNTPLIQYIVGLPNEQYNFKGEFTGLLTDFVTSGEVTSSFGNVDVDILLKTDYNDGGVLLKGGVETDSLDLAIITGVNSLGYITMNGGGTIEVDGNSDTLIISTDSVKVKEVLFNNYAYKNIDVSGKYLDNNFDGRVICNDENIKFNFFGELEFREEQRYNFYLDLLEANLNELNFDMRDSISKIKLKAITNITYSENKDFVGNLNISDSEYINRFGVHDLGNIHFESRISNNNFNSSLVSTFATAKYSGNASITKFFRELIALTIDSNFDNYFDSTNSINLDNKNSYEFSLETDRTLGIVQLLFPGLYIEKGTIIKAQIDSTKKLNLKLKSDRLAYGRNFLKDIDLDINGSREDVNVNLTSQKAWAGGFNFDTLYINAYGKSNQLAATIGVEDDTLDNKATLHTFTEFLSSPRKTIDINIANSNIITKNSRWEFEESDIVIEDGTLFIEDVTLYNGLQRIDLKGKLSNNNYDSLAVSLNKFDLDILNQFSKMDFNYKGNISGRANFSNRDNQSRLFVDMNGEEIYIANEELGDLKLLSKWNNRINGFDIYVRNTKENKDRFYATGTLIPSSTVLNIDAMLDEFPLKYFEPFLSGVVSKTSGTLSGDYKLLGPLNELDLTGTNSRVNDYNFTVDFTGVPYKLDGDLEVNSDGVFAKNATLIDGVNGKGIVTGGLRYNNFKDLFFDTDVSFAQMEALKTEEVDNEYFYGNAFATGNLEIRGSLTDVMLKAEVTSDENTSIHIPLSNSSTAVQDDLLSFTQKRVDKEYEYDEYDLFRSENNSAVEKSTELDVTLNTNINPQAEILIEINKAVGDVIRARGTGVIDMNINPEREIFDVYGDYNISEGSYKFVFIGLAAKDFIIQPGGVINFNGDISNTTLNLTATYRTKASINTLISDTTAVSSRRTVNCGILMTGSLMNPELAFSIDIPDLEPTTKARVESALNSEGKVQRQFMALLLSGGFVPDEQSGITNNTTLLYSNASEILSNQLNNILQQLNIPLDLGLNYQPNETGTDIFDVAISTQFFDNRILINGNIGNDPYADGNEDIIGNIDAEFKIDKNGKLRMTVFSHSSDKFSNYLEDKQRSGIGIGYQQEFNSFKNIFKRKKK